jgi:murein DD-endopeptidase MepM/ murein hydrolase activator NlpD
MKKEKYIYNPQTLNYERHSESDKTKYLRIFGVVSGITVLLGLGGILGGQFFPSSRERLLQQELSQTKFQQELMNDKVKDIETLMEKLHRRDNQLYRVAFSAEPVDDNLWNAGKGGNEKYAHLQGLPNAELLKTTLAKIDKLTGQIAIQAKSFDEVTELVKNKEQMLASIPSIRPVKILVKDIEALSGFGMRIHPIHKIAKMHTGIDFTAPTGTPIYTTGDGTVEEATTDGSGYGQHVIINHGFGYKTLYGHMSVMKVRTGQKVKRGELIGLVGSTGSSTGPHCHYEVIHNDEKINPINYVQDDLSPEDYRKLVNSSLAPMQSFD